MHLLRLLPGSLPGGSDFPAEGLLAHRQQPCRDDLQQREATRPWRDARWRPEMEAQAGRSEGAGDFSGEGLMKSEIRMSKSERSPKSELRTDFGSVVTTNRHIVRASAFGFLSDFGFRPSDF